MTTKVYARSIDQENFTFVFNTVADMVAYTQHEVGALIKTKGYYTAGDGGGASYLVQPGTPAHNADKDLGAGLVAKVQFSEFVNPRYFGLLADGSSDDLPALQDALEVCYTEGRNFKGGNYTCYISDTLYMPHFSDVLTLIEIDFAGMTIIPHNNLIETLVSGKLVGGTWVTAMNDPHSTNNSFGVTIKNLNIERPSIEDDAGKTAYRFKDFHQNCKFQNLTCRNFRNGFYGLNMFYSQFDTCMIFNQERIDGTLGGTGFYFDTENNLMELSNLAAVNVAFGYQFQGGVTATVMKSCSFEGQTIGLITLAEVYDLTIRDCYAENIKGNYWADFQSYTNVNIDNCYFNLNPTAPHPKALIHTRELPRTNILLGENNHYRGGITPENIFLNKGYGYRTIDLPPQTQGVNKENTIFSPADVGIGTIINQHTIDVGTGSELYSVAIGNSGICPGNYSGRMTSGGSHLNGLYNKVTTALQVTLDSQIRFSNTQILYVNLAVNDGFAAREYYGWIQNMTFIPIGGSTNDGKLTVNIIGNNQVQLQVTGTGPVFNILKAELRVI